MARFVSIALAFLLVAATLTQANAQPLTTIRVGTEPSDTAGEAFYGVSNNTFAAAGLDVKIVMLPNASAIADALVKGTIDIGAIDTGTMAAAHAKGAPLLYLAPGIVSTTTSPAFGIIVSTSAKFDDVKDVTGTIAVPALGDAMQLATTAWVDNNGGDVKKLTFIQQPYAAALPAAKSGAIEGVMASEPWLASASDGGARVFVEGIKPLATSFLLSGWATTNTWIHAHPPATSRFIGAMRQIAQWANAHHDESAPILAAAAKIPPSTTQQMHRADFALSFDVTKLQPVIDAAAKYGIIAAPFNASALIFGS
jgi:ABC-type nitrate/sulfonate/bicarbonate transport system substrate-binding protein